MELSEHYVGQRYDTVFTQVPSTELKDKKEEVKGKIKNLQGSLLIKYFPPKGVTVKKIQQHIDKMITTDNKSMLSLLIIPIYFLSFKQIRFYLYKEQGGVYIDLRGLSGEMGICLDLSQTNRSINRFRSNRN